VNQIYGRGVEPVCLTDVYMNEKLSLLVLFGGVSSEHEVSCASAASVLANIDREKYDIKTIGITKEGNWLLTGSPVTNIEDGSWERYKDNRRALLSPDRSVGGLLAEDEKGAFLPIKVDVVLPVLHGKNGEDGSMQGLLQIAGIPYVGSGTTASAVSMDKAVTKAVVEKAGGVSQAKCYVMQKADYDKNCDREISSLMEFFDGQLPLFVKPANAGSSVGISKVKSENDIPGALQLAFAEDVKAVIEETITGREIEVAVLGNHEPQASCIGEIFAANEFYDYNAKYENGESRTGIVTDLSPEKEAQIRDTAVKVYQILGCRGLSRVDFFLEEDGRIVFNEINTLPGFTNISMYPKLWEESGIGYSELIDRLIQLALE